MYDLPEIADATDALWSAIAAELVQSGVGDVPPVLARSEDVEVLWADGDLLFSQACGYPLVHAFEGRLRILATPRYRAPGCASARYASAIVVRKADPSRGLADLRGRVCAINDRSSHSGMNVLRSMIAPLASGKPFFREVLVTGSHAASIASVREGAADVCAVDAVTHALLARHRPNAVAGTRVLAWSPAAPGLPFVTRADAPEALVVALRRALEAAMRDPALEVARERLLLDGIEVLADGAYEAIRAMEGEAVSRRYPDLV